MKWHKPASHSCHPQSLGLSSAACPLIYILELEGTHKGCGTLLLVAEVGGNDCSFTWDVFEAIFHRNVWESSMSVNIPL